MLFNFALVFLEIVKFNLLKKNNITEVNRYPSYKYIAKHITKNEMPKIRCF